MNSKIVKILLYIVPIFAIALYFIDHLIPWYVFDIYVSVVALIAVTKISN